MGVTLILMLHRILHSILNTDLTSGSF